MVTIDGVNVNATSIPRTQLVSIWKTLTRQPFPKVRAFQLEDRDFELVLRLRKCWDDEQREMEEWGRVLSTRGTDACVFNARAFCPKCDTAVQAVAQPKLAYWGERFVAWLVDIVIIGAIVGFFRAFVWVAWPGYVLAPGVPSWIPFMDFGTSNIVYLLYWMLSEEMYGQSIGKMIMRIKVTRLDGRAPNMGQAAIESVGKAFLLPIDVIVGWFLYSSRRQRLFSYLSNTIVVRVKSNI